MRKLALSDNLLRETTTLQRQISTLLNCKAGILHVLGFLLGSYNTGTKERNRLCASQFYLDEVDNEITLEAFRLLVKELLRLFQVVNEGVINILGERSLNHAFSVHCTRP